MSEQRTEEIRESVRQRFDVLQDEGNAPKVYHDMRFLLSHITQLEVERDEKDQVFQPIIDYLMTPEEAIRLLNAFGEQASLGIDLKSRIIWLEEQTTDLRNAAALSEEEAP